MTNNVIHQLFISGSSNGYLFDTINENPIATPWKINCSKRQSAKRLPKAHSRVILIFIIVCASSRWKYLLIREKWELYCEIDLSETVKERNIIRNIVRNCWTYHQLRCLDIIFQFLFDCISLIIVWCLINVNLISIEFIQ